MELSLLLTRKEILTSPFLLCFSSNFLSADFQNFCSENAEGFLARRDKPCKAILFTRKDNTPKLWLDVAAACQHTHTFGEVRVSQECAAGLMAKFHVTPEMLPKIVAVRTRGDDGRLLTLLYDGASNIEAICSFLGGLADNNNDEHSGTEQVVRACEEEDEMKKNERNLPVIFL
jgi:hypothetical protein